MFQIHKQLLSATISSVQNISIIDTLKATDYRVLFFLMGHLDSMRAKAVKKSHIAEALNISKKKVSQSLDNLIASGLLIEEDTDHVERGYKFNL